MQKEDVSLVIKIFKRILIVVGILLIIFSILANTGFSVSEKFRYLGLLLIFVVGISECINALKY